MKLKELADILDGEVIGDPSVEVRRVAPIESAGPGDITFVHNEKYVQFAEGTRASAVIVSPELRQLDKNLIVTPNPYLAFARAVGALMDEAEPRAPGVHPSASVAADASIAEDVSVGPHVCVASGATVERGVTLMAGCFIGRGVRVGEETVIHPNTSLYHGISVGKRCLIHSNVAIGSPGFGWAPDGQRYERIPQVAKTVVGDDVSIGAGSIINRGALGDTVIGKGTKIDSLVIISHNVVIGENCLLVSQVGVSGSVKIGNHVTLGGQVGVAGHLEIGDNVRVAAQSGVSRSLPANGVYFGSPARPMGHARRTIAAFQKLPELRDEIRNVQKRMVEITALLEKDVGDMTSGDT